MLAGKVGVIENVITQPVRRNGIVDIVAFVCIPVLRQLFRAENKHGFVAVLIILYNRESCESLAETDTIRENAAVEFFKLADDCENSVTLEIVEHSPDFALLEARCFVGQLVLRNIIQKLFENVVECDKVNILRRVLAVRSRNVLDYDVRNLLQLLFVVPKLFKELNKVIGVLETLSLLHRIVGIITSFAAKIDGGKSIYGHIGAFIDRHETHHLFLGDIRFEDGFAPDPVRALFRDCFLRQLIAEFYFKLSSIQTALSGNAGNIEFALSFGCFLGYKGGRGKNETQLVNALKLFFKFLIRID